MIINRSFAMPSAWTFTIPPIRTLLNKYVGTGSGWIDPFAGNNSPAEITNDHNPDRKAKYHMDATEFCKSLKGEYNGILFDPPYSARQVSEHYKEMGLTVSALDTSSNFYIRVISAAASKIKVGGYAISFGWNSNGFGKGKGFEIIEILLVAHGLHHNDTIVTVEQKIQYQLFSPDPANDL